MALGLSIAGAVFVNQAVGNLGFILPDMTHAQLVQAVSGSGSRVLGSLTPEKLADTIHGIVLALRQVFILGYVAAAMGLICSLFISVSLLISADRFNANSLYSGRTLERSWLVFKLSDDIRRDISVELRSRIT